MTGMCTLTSDPRWSSRAKATGIFERVHCIRSPCNAHMLTDLCFNRSNYLNEIKTVSQNQPHDHIVTYHYAWQEVRLRPCSCSRWRPVSTYHPCVGLVVLTLGLSVSHDIGVLPLQPVRLCSPSIRSECAGRSAAGLDRSDLQRTGARAPA